MKYLLTLALLITGCASAKLAGYPTTVAEQEQWIEKRWPWIKADLGKIHPGAFRYCLEPLEDLAKKWPEPFKDLRRIYLSIEDGWPATSSSAWYDYRDASIGLRPSKWDTAAEGADCPLTMPHELGHHVDHWLQAKPEMREKVKAFVKTNAGIGTGSSPSESFAEGFKYLNTQPSLQWDEYTKRLAKFLAPWKKGEK